VEVDLSADGTIEKLSSVESDLVSNSSVDISKVEGASEIWLASIDVCFPGIDFFVMAVKGFLFLSGFVGVLAIVEFGFFLRTKLMQDLRPQHWITIFFCFFSCLCFRPDCFLLFPSTQSF